MSILPVFLIQAGGWSAPEQTGMVALFIIGGGAVFLGFMYIIFRHATKERELAHAERIKAIEKGFLLDDIEDERRFRKGAFRLAFCIGIIVPIAALIIAAATVTNMAYVSDMFTFLVWSVAGAVGVAGAASGAWLAQGVVARLGGALVETISALLPMG